MVIVQRNSKIEEKKALYSAGIYGVVHHKGYGAAVDIGTTTVVVSVFDMELGKAIGSRSETNHQVNFGSDVMMRIMHCTRGKYQILHEKIVSQIEEMIEGIFEENNISENINKMVVVGNTTMCHIFLGKDVSGLAGTPFKTAYKGRVVSHGKELGMKLYGDVEIVVMPGIAGHVGADAASVIMEQKLYAPDKIELAIDIGTNAEIILNNHGKIYVCSAAAGPAFEGKGIRCGIRAGIGAINSVKISKANGNIILGIISDSNAKADEKITGICGSGLVDAIAELLKIGILQSDGYIISREEAYRLGIKKELSDRINSDSEGNFFVLYSSDRIIGQKDIIITQNDIRNVQLAKGAIQAGVECLMEESGVSLNELEKFIVCGVFGKLIHQSSAVKFGLLPKLDNIPVTYCGNVAGNGAAHALLDNSFCNSFESKISGAVHIELADKKIFQNKFMNAMELKSWYYNSNNK